MKYPDCGSDSYQKRGQILESARQAADLDPCRGLDVLPGGVIHSPRLLLRVARSRLIRGSRLPLSATRL